MASKRQLNSSTQNTNNALFQGITQLMRRRTHPWVGTMTELKQTLETRAPYGITPTGWPASPSSFRMALNRVVNRLRNAGISVRFNRSTQRLVSFSTR
jgi:hypothetical protein